MDFSTLTNALASKSYHQIAQICDALMLQVASEGIAFRDEWPYAIHLLGHIYIDDINSARFLWKTIPLAVKESQPEVSAVWKVGQKLWIKDYGGVHEALREFSWSSVVGAIISAFSDLYLKRMFELVVVAYSTISIQDTAVFLGMTEDDAANCKLLSRVTKLISVLQHGWIVDPASRMLTVKKEVVAKEQKLDPSKLQRLTEYVFHLEH